MDQYTEVTNRSWGSRLGGAFKGILVGIVLFIAAFPLLFWNEGRALERYKTLEEGQGAVVSVSSSEVDSGSQGKLVHTSGLAQPMETLSDPQFGISASAIKLRRNVEMYQWQETSHSEEKKQLGGGTETVTTYQYQKIWSGQLQHSTGFRHPEGHENPDNMPYQTETWVASNVALGGYRLPRFLSEQLSGFSPLPLSQLGELPQDLRDHAQVSAGGYYVGYEPGNPRVGDLRITFEQVGASEISLVAQQSGDTFVPYRASAGGQIALLEKGIQGPEEMFRQAHQSNLVLTWILRLAGLLVMTIGLNMLLRPLAVLADVVPMIGSIVGAGSGIIAFLIALALSLITIAIAWLFYRPLIGVGLLLAAAVAMYLTRRRVAAAPQAIAASH